jgi:hypothetical protein
MQNAVFRISGRFTAGPAIAVARDQIIQNPDLEEFCANKDAAASARLDARVVYDPIAFLKERSPALSARCRANEKSCAMTRQGPWTPGTGSNGRMVPSSSPAIRPACRLAVLLRTADRPKRPRHCWQREERLAREAAPDRLVAQGRQSAVQRSGFP